MQSVVNLVREYVEKRKDVMRYFNSEGDYFIKPLLGTKWSVNNEGDFYILSYWEGPKNKTNAIIVKKYGNPLIFEKEDFTMIIAIDCVKIAFVFDNNHKASV